jgi:hypothetical protein
MTTLTRRETPGQARAPRLITAVLLPCALVAAGCSGPAGKSTRGPATPTPDTPPAGPAALVMAFEDLAIHPGPDENTWSYRETYRVRNDGGDQGSIVLTLTEHAPCEKHEEHCSDNLFKELATTVDGAAIEYETRMIPDARGQRGPSTQRRFDLRVPGGKTVELSHRYHRKRTWADNGILGVWYPFPGQPQYSGPIERTRVAIHPRDRPWKLSYRTTSFELSRFRHGGAGHDTATEISFSAGQRTGDETAGAAPLEVSLYMLTGDANVPGGPDCPELLMFSDDLDPAVAIDSFNDLTDDELGVCRDLMYARHGKKFDDETRNALFYRPPGRDAEGAIEIGLSLSQNFDDALLSDAERRYIAAAESQRQRRSKRK